MPAPALYSPHFSRRELIFSETAARQGIDNTPTPEVERNLITLCNTLLEPLRAEFGAIAVSSGFRCAALNAAVRGSQTSAHMTGCAADVKPVDPAIKLTDMTRWIERSTLPFDQVIYEFGSWVHVGIATPAAAPRRRALMIFAPETYLAFDPVRIPADRVA